MTVLRELSKCRLDLVGAQEFRWDGSETELAGEYTFSMKREMRAMN
jgi:hypothetical protein